MAENVSNAGESGKGFLGSVAGNGFIAGDGGNASVGGIPSNGVVEGIGSDGGSAGIAGKEDVSGIGGVSCRFLESWRLCLQFRHSAGPPPGVRRRCGP